MRCLWKYFQKKEKKGEEDDREGREEEMRGNRGPTRMKKKRRVEIEKIKEKRR